jgi:hypothetical protein
MLIGDEEWVDKTVKTSIQGMINVGNDNCIVSHVVDSRFLEASVETASSEDRP